MTRHGLPGSFRVTPVAADSRVLRHYARLSAVDAGFVRSPGPGLGNLLFPIARALVGRHRHGGDFIHPTMRQIKIGPLLRREREWRTYGDLLRGRHAAEWRDWLRARHGTRLREHLFDGSQRGVTILYEGTGNGFHDILEHRDLIAGWLSDNLRHTPTGEACDIGMHVRLGDFSGADPRLPNNNISQPFEWYRAALNAARRMTGKAAPSILLFTDGEPSDVCEKLKAGPLRHDESRNALQAMLTLSRSRILITSRSSFSMWAAFLGGMPALWDSRHEVRTKTLPQRHGLDHVL